MLISVNNKLSNMITHLVRKTWLTEVPEDEASKVEEDAGDVERDNLVAVLELESAESLQDHRHHTQPIESLHSRITSHVEALMNLTLVRPYLEHQGVGHDEVDREEGDAVGEKEHCNGSTDRSGLLPYLDKNKLVLHHKETK